MKIKREKFKTNSDLAQREMIEAEKRHALLLNKSTEILKKHQIQVEQHGEALKERIKLYNKWVMIIFFRKKILFIHFLKSKEFEKMFFSNV